MQRPTDLPEPFDNRPVKGNPVLKRLAIVAVLVALAVAAIQVPIPVFYNYLPGPVKNIERLVTIDGASTYSSEGALLLTTVSVDVNVTFVEMIQAMFDPHARVVMRDQVTGGLSLEQLEEQQFEAMDASQDAAIQVALQELDLAHPTSAGVKIEDTSPGTDAAKLLRSGDRIVRVDGVRTPTTCDVGRQIDTHEPGDDVELTVRRGKARKSFSLTTVPSPQDPTQPLAGIFMSDVNYSFDPGLEVEFETGEIAGPSAGLMMTLAIYDALTPDDLTKGLRIAGTGEISCDGGIGAIGGIEQKVAGAEARGADVFLSPAANFEAAQAAARDIEVFSVSDFSEALEYLADLE